MLPNISRNKGNHTVNFGQLVGNKMRNIFLRKSYAKCGGENIPRLFSKKSKLRISLDHQSKVLYSFFNIYQVIYQLLVLRHCYIDENDNNDTVI